MTVETFLRQFAHLAAAPNGIPKLRELILQLAVRGKLVPQDPNDAPASGSPSSLGAADHTFPQGWVASRLDEVGDWAIGTGFPKREQGLHEGSILFCKVSDMNLPGNETYIRDTVNTIDANAVERIRARAHPFGTVIFPKIGGAIATNKRRILDRPTAIDNNCLGIIPGERCTTSWLLILLRSLDLTEYQSGTSVPALSQGVIGAIPVGLPPFAEQKRIVAKVDELMALCDDLEAKQQAKQAKRIALNRASLHALTEPNGTSLSAAWHRVRDRFDDLYTIPETVAELRQTILQLAVIGRLVPQDPNDEPASELLKRIQAEKGRLIAKGKLRKPKPLPPIEEDESQTKLPSGWEVVRLGTISEIGTGTTPSRAEPDYWVGGTHDWVTSAQTGDPFIEHGSELVTTRALSECRLRVYPEGTLIVALYGQGRTRGQISELRVDASVNQACAAIQYPIAAWELREYTKILFWKMYHEIREQAAGGAQPNLNVGKITQIAMPLPPIAEQKRIVAKVDRLMTLCDDLEAKLQQSQTDADNLLTAIVHELVSTSGRRRDH